MHNPLNCYNPSNRLGLVGKKIGMTRLFNDDGSATPVTVVLVDVNRVTQVKDIATDGYCAIQITVDKCKASRLSKPLAGHYAKAQVEPGRGLWEFRLNEAVVDVKVGSELTVDLLSKVKKVDVVGTSIGKGFAGAIKAWHFNSQDETHGNSVSTRAPGSIGQRQSPGKVFKGKKMACHLGNSQVTTQNLALIKVDAEKNLLFIHGAIAGAANSTVIIFPALKNQPSAE